MDKEWELSGRKDFPGKRPAVKLYYQLFPTGTTRECVEWIKKTYGVVIRSKRVSTIRKQLFPNFTIERKVPVQENNGTVSTTTNERSRLTHATFYKVCECMKEHKQKFIDERPNLIRAAEMLTDLSGIKVGENSINEIREATGVIWESKRTTTHKEREHRRLAIRTIVTAVVRLYRKLDEEIPSALLDLYEEETGRVIKTPIKQETDNTVQ